MYSCNPQGGARRGRARGAAIIISSILGIIIISSVIISINRLLPLLLLVVYLVSLLLISSVIISMNRLLLLLVVYLVS